MILWIVLIVFAIAVAAAMVLIAFGDEVEEGHRR